jgi:hypothetical protein
MTRVTHEAVTLRIGTLLTRLAMSTVEGKWGRK